MCTINRFQKRSKLFEIWSNLFKTQLDPDTIILLLIDRYQVIYPRSNPFVNQNWDKLSLGHFQEENRNLHKHLPWMQKEVNVGEIE